MVEKMSYQPTESQKKNFEYSKIYVFEPDLKNKWKDICNEYLKFFLIKHEYDDVCNEEHLNDYWVGNEPGDIANIGDMFVDMSDIRYDIDNDVYKDSFETWYWKNLDRYEMGLKYMNYPSFCKGAPDPISKEKENEIIELRKKVQDAKDMLDKEIQEYEKQTGVKYKSFWHD